MKGIVEKIIERVSRIEDEKIEAISISKEEYKRNQKQKRRIMRKK